VHAQNNEVNGRYFLRYLANMTMIQYYFNIEDIDGPYWTLIIELLFYLFVIVIINLRKLNYISQTGFIISAFCACYSLPPFFNNYYIHALLVAIPLLAYFPLFYAGIILYKMKFGEVTIPKLAAFLSTFIFQCLMFTNCYKNHHLITIYQYIPALTLIYGLFLLFLYDKINFMVNPVTLWLGRISYSLYLFHQFIGIELLIPAFMKYLKLSFWPSAGLALCIVLILVNLINKYIERPSQIYLKNKNPFRSLTGNSLRMV
jgi:peptidoglycan/LPS O-acetylase OafA/YrhL